MGNNPSKGDAPSGHVPNASGDRKVVRRTSLNAIPTHKATVADPSASRETAAGHSAGYQGSVQHRLQSRNTPDQTARTSGKSEKYDAKSPNYTKEKSIPTPDLSNPVQVPAARHAAGRDPMDPSAPPMSSYYNASQHLQRPPRLPLPIADATATPGSPLMGPEDSHIQSMPADRLFDEQMNQETSHISTEAMDGEEVQDELQPFTPSGVGKAVPTVIEWSAPGQKVYVTGTFVNWEKKFRLHRG